MTINTSGLGGGGSVIKSIQRGQLGLQPETVQTITISAINPAKSSLNISSESGVSATSSGAVGISCGGTIINATQVRFFSGFRLGGEGASTQSTSSFAYWEVIEYV